MIISLNNPYQTNIEAISFVIFYIVLDFSPLNEVHRHNKVVTNNMGMMDQILDHLYQPIQLPIENRNIFKSKLLIILTSGQL
jgi:hypothetical protein